MPDRFALFVACLPGLEPLLANELRALDIPCRPEPGGATCEGDVRLIMRACRRLGTASHVLLRIVRFRCRALGELQRKASTLPWRDLLSPRVPLALSARSKRSRVYHTKAIAERIHNAIGAAFGQAPLTAKDGDAMTAQINVRFLDDVCTISLDATATPLHRRGYRLDGRKAPLREDIAHALVLASGRRPDEALLDPFCGSGTIAIEAAGLALGLAPGRDREPALQHTLLFDTDAWQGVLDAEETRAPEARIAASDRDQGAVAATRANAERAGVGAAIDCDAHALAAQPWLQPGAAPARGAVVTNPPFGVRVREQSQLVPLYQTLGHRVRQLGGGWRVAVLAHDVRLSRRTGLPLQAAFTTRHGGLSITAMVGAVGAEEAPPPE